MTRRPLPFAAFALALGLGLLLIALRRTDFHAGAALVASLGFALPLVLLPSLAWHLVRTAAWWNCFPRLSRPSFGRAFRVRIAAEAFSFVTISGLGGEPLKVMLLTGEVPVTAAAAAVALERITYLLVTALVASIG